MLSVYLGGKVIYNKILWSLIAALVIIIGGFILSFYTDFTDSWFGNATVNQEKNVNDEPIKDTESKPETKGEGVKDVNEDASLNPFKQKRSQKEMTDNQFRDYIHKMSHQKVIADSKWGFYEISKERITWLLEALENEKVKNALSNYDAYHDILTRWNKDDFSFVDKDHNTVWILQGGTIGVATGILSKEDEEDYIKHTKENTR